MGNSEVDLKKLAVKAQIKMGLAIRGSSVDKSEMSVTRWIKKG